jgi:general secretion pathway protein D
MVSGATQGRRQQQSGQGAVAFTTSEGVRIAAVNENNQLLVRATPGQWEKLLPVIERLDEKPLQVQIETKVLEVTLQGAFQFGVQYYLGGLIGTQPGSPPFTDESFLRHQGAAGFGGVQYQPDNDTLFYSFAGNRLQFAVRAMESSGNAKVLSAPSTVVLNNQETTFKVGEKIPVVQTFYTPGLGVGSTRNYNVGQVQYIDTGVLLDVVPRVSPGGLVYMDIQQIVSNPTTQDKNGNFTIANRSLSTQVAVQSGQTVLLGGLIQQTDTINDTGVPFLSRIPVLGHLFGRTDQNKKRSELIVLITPRIIRNPEDARRVTDEYQTQFESLKPILPKNEGGAEPAAPAPAAPTPTPSSAGPSSTVQGDRWAVQVATFARDADAERLRYRLQQLGYTGYVGGASTAEGERWRVYAGPVAGRDAAERLRDAIAGSLHIGGMVVTRQ